LLTCGDSVRLHSAEVIKLSICTDQDEALIRNIRRKKDLEVLLYDSSADNTCYPELKLLRAIYLPELRDLLNRQCQNNAI